LFAFIRFFLFILLLATLPAQGQVKTPEDRIEYAQGLIDEGKSRNDPVLMADGYFILGKVEENRFRYTEAYRHYASSLAIYRTHQIFEKEGKVLLRLSGLELHQGFLVKSKEYLWKALEVYKKHNHRRGLASVYLQAGVTYFSAPANDPSTEASLDSAIYYYTTCEHLLLELDNERELAKVRYNLGVVYLKKEDIRAIELLYYAVEKGITYESPNQTFSYRRDLAAALLNFNRMEECLAVLKESQSILDSRDDISLFHQAHHYHAYSSYYRAMGKIREALNLSEKSRVLYSLIPTSEKRAGYGATLGNKIAKQHQSLSEVLRQSELEAHQNKIVRQRSALLMLSLGIIALALLSYLLYKNYMVQKSLLLKNDFLIKEQSHRVKNNLQVISSMLSLQHDQLTDETSRTVLSENQMRIDSMILLHKQLYENKDVELIDMEELIYDIVGSVAFTFGKNEHEVNLDMGVKYLPPDLATSVGVILNELVVNSYKHTFCSRSPRISISSRRRNEHIYLTYEDFGEENLETVFKAKDGKGFGLQLIDMILFQINGELKYSFREKSVFTLDFKYKEA
jgi:two-component sensor histidine kinase